MTPYLFLLSVSLVIIFAYFTANILDSKNLINNIIYFILSGFANIVLTFEILSLLSKISVEGVLICNFIFALISLIVWIIKKRPEAEPDFKNIFCKLKNVLMLDKTLLVLSIFFVFMICVSLWLVSFIQSSDAASVFYHVTRSLFWIENGNLNHFNIADARTLVFPINSEILYAWVILFLKKDIFLPAFSVIGYVLYVTALFGLLGKFTASLRPKLWIIIIVSSFTSVITHLSSTETNILVAGLILSSLYLYINFLEKNKISQIYMSSLAFALALGVKTSAFILFPAIVIWFLTVAVIYKKNDNFKAFGWFIFLGGVNFVIFSSYNYILNFIDFGHFLSSEQISYSHQNLHGIKGFFFNFISYFFMMFEYPEFEQYTHLSEFLFSFKKLLLKSFDLGVLVGVYSNDMSTRVIDAARSGFGLLGIFVFMPSLIISSLRLFLHKTKKELLLNSFSLIFVISFLLMTYSLVYMSFNNRFIVTFALVSAPVLYYSYSKKQNIYKFIVSLIAVFYLVYIPLHITNKNVLYILNYFKKGYDVSQVREIGYCSAYDYNAEIHQVNINCFLRNYIKNFDKSNKILYFSQDGDGLLAIKLLQFEGFDINVDLIENAKNIDFSNYNIVITLNNQQSASLFSNLNKLEYGLLRADGVICQYNDISGAQILTPNNAKPYNSVCRFEDDFFNIKSFKLYDTLIFSEDINGIYEEYKYYVFENRTRPIIK